MPLTLALDLHPCFVSADGAGTMNKLRQSLRRRKPAYVPEASRPHQWQADEDAVRKGTCSFPVRVSGRGSAGRGCSWMPRADVRVRSSGCSWMPRADVRVRSSAQGGDWDSLCGRDLTSAKNCGSCNMSAPPRHTPNPGHSLVPGKYYLRCALGGASRL